MSPIEWKTYLDLKDVQMENKQTKKKWIPELIK